MAASLGPAGIRTNPLIRRLVNLGMEPAEFVIFGSGPLLPHGIRNRLRDLDIVARGSAWRRACELGLPAKGGVTGDPIVQFWGGRIEFSQRWISGHWDTDELIDRAEVIDDLRFAQLRNVLTYKEMLKRPKDLADIDPLRARLGSGPAAESTGQS